MSPAYENTGYRYLASPYTSSNPGEQISRYYAAMKCLAWLLKNRVYTYSPIVHCHPMAEKYALPGDHDYWQEYNRRMIYSSSGLLVLKIEGWDTSVGVADELAYARGRSMVITSVLPFKDGYLMEPE